ncbi:MAG TPA: hypothetical protein VMI52_06915 [Acetobacteraceae bacterium]|nr:hypothetical protein [Acetobacteraceae bacterium]
MARHAILLAALVGLAGCGATPAGLGITGPGGAGPASFTEKPPDADSAVGVPGIPDSGSPYSSSNRPAGEAAKPGGFYGYN